MYSSIVVYEYLHVTTLRLSVGYTMDTMYFGQLDNPVDVDPDVQMPQFKLIREFVKDCSQNYTTGTWASEWVRGFVYRKTVKNP